MTNARTVYAVHLRLSGESAKARAHARVYVRRWIEEKVGGWPAGIDLNNCMFTVGDRSSVRCLSAEANIDGLHHGFWELTYIEPHEDPSLQWKATVIVGGRGDEAFCQIRYAIEAAPGHRHLDGWVRFDAEVPSIVPFLMDKIGAGDAGETLSASPISVVSPEMTRALASLIANPSRRLPVVVATRTQGAPVSEDAYEFATKCAGLAHVYDIESLDEAKHLERLLGGKFVQNRGDWRIFFARWCHDSNERDHPLWRPDRQNSNRYGSFGHSTSRQVYAMSAFRTSAPEWTGLAAAAAHKQRIQTMRSEAEAAAKSSGGRLDEAVLVEWETDLAKLDQAEKDLTAVRSEVSRLAKENAALRDWRASSGSGRLSEAPSEPERKPPATVSEAIEQAEATLTNLEFLDRAKSTAKDCVYRWPERILADLTALNEVAGQWKQGTLCNGGWVPAVAEAGAIFALDISDTARTKYSSDYSATNTDGETVMLGPHLKRGASTGPLGHYRCYVHIDDETGKVQVGYIGAHLRDHSSR